MLGGLRNNKAFPAQPEKAKLLSRQRLNRLPGTGATLLIQIIGKYDINKCSEDIHRKTNVK